MRRLFALLMLLILASTPILDGGCFTSRVITGGSAEYWSDLHAPCAAYVGADGSLTLVLPDRDNLKQAKFFAVKFSAEEVKGAGRAMQGRHSPLRLDAKADIPLKESSPDQGPMVWRAPMKDSPWKPSYHGQYREVDAALVFNPSRDAARVSPLPGLTEAEWMAALPAGGYWLHAGASDAEHWSGFSSRYGMGNWFGPIADPTYLDNNWNLCIAQSGRWFNYCQVRREGGGYMAPSTTLLWIPVTLVADAVTLPIQVTVVVVGCVGALTESSGSTK